MLSASTKRIDRGAKLDEYRSLETLQECVLVNLPIVSGALELSSVGARVPFAEIYAGSEL